VSTIQKTIGSRTAGLRRAGLLLAIVLASGKPSYAQTSDPLAIDPDGRVKVGTALDVGGPITATALDARDSITTVTGAIKAKTLEARDSITARKLAVTGAIKANTVDVTELITASKLNATGSIETSILEVTDSMTVNGGMSMRVRYQRDDEAETSYVKPLQRYHMSLTAQQYALRTKTIPQATLVALCGTPDGCEVRLGMTRWDNPSETETASRSLRFYYSRNDGHWRKDSDTGDAWGVAGNGKVEHAVSAWDTCYFTDGIYPGGGQSSGDAAGMRLLVWNKFGGASRTCELTLIP
jgi:hypothetical protein